MAEQTIQAGKQKRFLDYHDRVGRFRSQVKIVEAQLQSIDSRENGQSVAKAHWRASATDLLTASKAEDGKDTLDERWRYLFAAERWIVYGLTDAEIEIQIRELRKETTKTRGWRREAIESILDLTKVSADGQCPSPEVCRAALFEALSLLHEHYSNQWRKIDLRRRSLLLAFGILLFAIVILPLVLAGGLRFWDTSYSEFWMKAVFEYGVVLFGVLGAVMSTAISLTGRSLDARIPELILEERFFGVMRPMIGGAAALAIHVLLQSDLISDTLAATLAGNNFGAFALAIVSGFSERLVVRTVSAVSEK